MCKETGTLPLPLFCSPCCACSSLHWTPNKQLQLAQASRAWRKGIRAVITVNISDLAILAKLNEEGAAHNEVGQGHACPASRNQCRSGAKQVQWALHARSAVVRNAEVNGEVGCARDVAAP